MLQLARALANNDEKFFGGWILAGVEAHVKGSAVHFTNKIVLSKARKAILDVEGASAFGTVLKRLRTFLILPVENTTDNLVEENVPEGRLLFAHYFTPQEIADYVAYTGDENIIHKGEHPIVPGLCMACWLQEKLGLDSLDWRISFLHKVYANELVSFYTKDDQLLAYVDKTLAFTVKIL